MHRYICLRPIYRVIGWDLSCSPEPHIAIPFKSRVVVMWTYDNEQFLKFCLIFFGFGSMLNFSFGLYAMSLNHILNGILLGIISVWIIRMQSYYENIGG